MLATSYLPRRWPAKYFRLCKSLRPCSGWERVGSLRFVTSELSFAVYRLFSAFSLYAESCIRYLSSIYNFFRLFAPVQSKIASLTPLSLRSQRRYRSASLSVCHCLRNAKFKLRTALRLKYCFTLRSHSLLFASQNFRSFRSALLRVSDFVLTLRKFQLEKALVRLVMLG